MKNLKYIITAVAILVFSSCVNFNNPDKLPQFSDIRIDNVNMQNSANYVVTISASVKNPVNKKFAANDFTALVYRKGKLFGQVELNNPIQIQQLYLGRIQGVFNCQLKDAKQAIMLGLTYKNIDPADFTADISSQIKAGGMKKRVKASVTGKQVESLVRKLQ